MELTPDNLVIIYTSSYLQTIGCEGSEKDLETEKLI